MNRAVSMRRPTTWSARPRRTTSTSGSSGILTVDALVRTGQNRLGPARQLGPGDLGGQLLRLFLAASRTPSPHLASNPHLGVEALPVVRALLGNVIFRHPQRARGGQLLKARLPVQPSAQAG